MSRYRFPGLRSFEESDAAIFKGREKEKQTLFDLIMVERCAVMFAKSGAGKTSLLRAGIVPMLAGLPYQPVFIRLNRGGQSLTEQSTAQIAQVFGVGAAPGQTLWEYLKTINDNSGDTTPILFFDQFEEIFTLYEKPEARREFIAQLADVINCTLPTSVETALQNTARPTSGAERIALEKPPRVKVVFSIRSDLLSYLHELSDHIPGILRNRFELKGLRIENARKAITLPAASTAPGFDCPPFQFTPDALQDILGKLAESRQDLHSEPEIESFQLQLVCNDLEQKMLQKHRRGESPLHVEINTYGGKAGIERLLSDFYINTIKSIGDETQRKNARIVVEDTLIQNDRRVSVAESTLTQKPETTQPTPALTKDLEKIDKAVHITVSPETLRLLVDKRLLRREERPGLGNYYELVHDTLLAPVLRFKRERQLQEAAEKAKTEFRRKIRRALIAAVAVGVLMLIAVAMLVTVNNLRKQARYSYFVAESHLQNAQDRTLAFRLGEVAWNILPDSTQAPGSMLNAFYGDLLTIGDSVFAAPHYREYDARWAKPIPGSPTILLLRPDGQTLLLLDPSANTQQEFRPEGAAEIKDAALSPDGRRLLTLHDNDSIARLWDVATRTLLKPLVHEGPLSSAAFSPDGRYLTTNSADNAQRLWTSEGDFVKKYTNVAKAEALAAFSPDSKLLLVGKDDQTVELYPTGADKPSATLKATLGDIEQVQFSYPGRFVTMVSADWEEEQGSQVQVFDLQGKKIFEKQLPAEQTVVLAAADNAGEQLLLVLGDTLFQQINLQTKTESYLGDCFDRHRARITAARFSPDNRLIVSGGNDKTAKVWYRNRLTLTLPLRDRVASVFFSADSRYLVTATRGDKVRIWGLQDNPVLRLNTAGIPVAAFFKPGSHEVVAQDWSGQMYYWDTLGRPVAPPDWLQKDLLDAGDGQSVLIPVEKGWQRRNVYTGAAAVIAIEPTATDSIISDAPATAADIVAVLQRGAEKPDSSATTSMQPDRVELISDGGATRKTISFTRRGTSHICLSGDGRRLAAVIGGAGTDSVAARLELWDVAQQKRLAATDFTPQVFTLVFSADGKTLLMGSKGAIYRWNFAQTPRPFLLGEHDEGTDIRSVTVSKDGRFIATGALDKKVVLWDFRGRRMHTFHLPYGAAYGLQFSGDGQYLLSRHYQKVIFVWPLAPALLRQKLNAQDFRVLSAEERGKYGID